jgi:hypothetical protein
MNIFGFLRKKETAQFDFDRAEEEADEEFEEHPVGKSTVKTILPSLPPRPPIPNGYYCVSSSDPGDYAEVLSRYAEQNPVGPLQQTVKCDYCGSWTGEKAPCVKCGAPVGEAQL